MWRALAEFAVECEVVWDIGANIGSFAIQALHGPRVTTEHRFESQPLVPAILRLNLAPSAEETGCHEFALGDRAEERAIAPEPNVNSAMATLDIHSAAVNGQGTLLVACTTSDTVDGTWLAPSTTLMKLAVEGWERFVLRGALGILTQNPPKAIAFKAPSDESGTIPDLDVVRLLGT